MNLRLRADVNLKETACATGETGPVSAFPTAARADQKREQNIRNFLWRI
ncbi:MAG: hypothetical protein HZA89_09125 [Verrucomicrobia bacterium]|nr:hypothetical protein [Verrucomicrobiota bacterium]